MKRDVGVGDTSMLERAIFTATILGIMAALAWHVGPPRQQSSDTSDAGVDTRIDDADGCPAFAMMSFEVGGPLHRFRVVRTRTETGFGCMILDPGTTTDEEVKMWEADNWGNPKR